MVSLPAALKSGVVRIMSPSEHISIEPPDWLTDPEDRATVKRRAEFIWPIWKMLAEFDMGMHQELYEEGLKLWQPYFDAQEK